MKIFLGIYFVLVTLTSYSQSNKKIDVRVHLMYGSENLQAETWYPFKQKDSVWIETFKFYLSNFTLFDAGLPVFTEENSYHLIDFQDSTTTLFTLTIPKKKAFNTVQFNLGLDSLTNVGGVRGGVLDPTNGMYWTWQTGYIHLKLEGKSNLCETRNNAFILHLGGYTAELNSKYVVQLITNSQQAIDIYLDIKQVFSTFDLRTENHIMSPSQAAVDLVYKLASQFRVR
jgi:hypothetical protein